MDRYDLYCEAQYSWTDPALDECLHRVMSAHAPYEAKAGDRNVRLNVASGNEDYRKKSVAVLEAFIRGAERAPNCKTIVAHPAPHYWDEDAGKPCEVSEVGVYEHFVESLKHLAGVARESGLNLAIENNRNPWKGIDDSEEYDHETHAGKVPEYFATSAREWAGLPGDVDNSSFGLCLDTSHAVTYALRFPVEARSGVIGLFTALGGDNIRHIHWNDNVLGSNEGRKDAHLTLGKGTISRDYHLDVWDLPNVECWLLEHWEGEGELAYEMRFIERL